jgi:hypothetical protein
MLNTWSQQAISLTNSLSDYFDYLTPALLREWENNWFALSNLRYGGVL